jgi:hypothetical protein
MKPIKNCLIKGGLVQESNGGAEFGKVHDMHVWKITIKLIDTINRQ